MPASLAQLAELTGATLRGAPDTPIHGAAGLHNARPGDIALVTDPRYAQRLPHTSASAIVVGPAFDPASTGLPLLIAQDPAQAFEAIAAALSPPSPPPEPGVHPAAVVAPDAQLGEGVAIQACCVVESGAAIGAHTVLRPFCFVGREARIGSHGLLHPHVTVLDRCAVGDRAILHSGVVIGADGYGYDTRDGVHHKLPQHGIVEIGDDVEIGANSTVDRARYGRTVIASGTKIDNLVMVAHNVVVGEHSLLVAQCGLAGSAVLGHHVTIAAQAGVVGHITVGDRAVVGAQAGVHRDVPPGQVVLGAPAQEIDKERRCLVYHQKLPEFVQRLRQLTKAVDALSRKANPLEGTSEDHPQAR